MPNIRAVVVEMDGADAAVLAAIAHFVNGADALRREPVSLALVEAPKALPPAAVAAVAAAKRVVRRAKAAPVKHAPAAKRAEKSAAEMGEAAVAAKVATASGNPGWRQRVYDALKAVPTKSADLVHRFAKECNAGSIYLALKELRAAGVVETRTVDDEVKYARVG